MACPDLDTNCPGGAVSHTAPAIDTTHAQAWAALAPLIAGAPQMRFADRAGKYKRPRSPLRITRSLPSRAAAVMVHGTDGSVATLCLDLDTSKARQSVVDADAAAIASMLDSCELRFVTDHSPSGGRHIYIPLARRLPAEEAREIVEALGLRFASLDPGPHQNITDGCIRPPGSPHKSGAGHQELDTPLSLAFDVLKKRNPEAGVQQLQHLLADSIKALRERRNSPAPVLTLVPGRMTKSAAVKNPVLRDIARTGTYTKGLYTSPSEARMAVLTHLANSNASLPEIQQRLGTDLAGLASLYRTPKDASRLLPYEWAKASRWVAENPAPGAPVQETSLNYDTEPALTHSGGTNPGRSAESVLHEINDLENVLYAVLDQRLARTGREGISLRLLLRAVIGFARAKKSLVIDVGCRSFALEMGKHHGTVARLLPLLEKHTEGLVERIEFAHGRHGDVYLLTLPKQWESTAKALSWRKGRIFGARPVFWALGDVAALVYEAIERQRIPSTAADLVRATGIGRTAVDQALKAMAGHSMIERRHGAWTVIRSTSLAKVAQSLGMQDVYEEQKRRIREQRLQWQAHLERFTQPPLTEDEIHDAEKEAYYTEPPDYGDGPDPGRERRSAA